MKTSRPEHSSRLIQRFTKLLSVLAVTGLTLHSAMAGTVQAWGDSSFGGTTIPAGLGDVKAIAAGNASSAALKSNGTVVVWGSNLDGQAIIPSGLSGVTAIAEGSSHVLALKTDGTVVAWGGNNSGQTTVPPGLCNVKAISAGGAQSVALKTDGTVVAWGDRSSDMPLGLSGVAAIACGDSHTLALKTDGTLVAWGAAGFAQTTIPAGLTGVVAIAAGFAHNVVLKSDHTVVAWAADFAGQATVPAGLTGVTAVSAGYAHTLALRADGTVVAWGGANGYDLGQTSVPAGLSGVTAIDAGYNHSVVLVGPPAPEISVFKGDNPETPNTELQDNIGTIKLVATVGSSGTVQTFSVKNTGKAKLTGLAIRKNLVSTLTNPCVNPTDFIVSVLPVSVLAPAEYSTFKVRFSPKAKATSSVTLQISSNDGNESPFHIRLKGLGVLSPHITILQPSDTSLVDGVSVVDFGDASISAADPGKFRTFVIRNDGNAILKFTSVKITGPNEGSFQVTLAPQRYSLLPRDHTDFQVTFKPTSFVGIRNAVIHIRSNDIDVLTFDIKLVGQGVKP